ncbi:hypothetical protein [Rana grylio virus]|uniref:Uncharacterized protein n=1 Tax=Rana grylio virus TaxID=380178 RepID=H9XFH8_FRG3V|nr:hypothetical protein [Rana grylio virus]
METLVQAYLDIQGKIAEFRREIKALRVEEKAITANLFEAMGEAGVESIRSAKTGTWWQRRNPRGPGPSSSFTRPPRERASHRRT